MSLLELKDVSMAYNGKVMALQQQFPLAAVQKAG